MSRHDSTPLAGVIGNLDKLDKDLAMLVFKLEARKDIAAEQDDPGALKAWTEALELVKLAVGGRICRETRRVRGRSSLSLEDRENVIRGGRATRSRRSTEISAGDKELYQDDKSAEDIFQAVGEDTPEDARRRNLRVFAEKEAEEPAGSIEDLRRAAGVDSDSEEYSIGSVKLVKVPTITSFGED